MGLQCFHSSLLKIWTIALVLQGPVGPSSSWVTDLLTVEKKLTHLLQLLQKIYRLCVTMSLLEDIYSFQVQKINTKPLEHLAKWQRPASVKLLVRKGGFLNLFYFCLKVVLKQTMQACFRPIRRFHFFKSIRNILTNTWSYFFYTFKSRSEM